VFGGFGVFAGVNGPGVLTGVAVGVGVAVAEQAGQFVKLVQLLQVTLQLEPQALPQ